MNALQIVVRARDRASRVLNDVGDTGVRSGDRIRRSWDRATRIATGVAAVGAAGAAAAGGMIAAANSTADYAREIRNASRQSGMTTDALQLNTQALGDLGVAEDTAVDGMRELNLRLGEAATEGGEVAEGFKGLGVAVRDANGNIRPTGEVLDEVMAKLAQVESPAKRAALGAKIFGDEAGFAFSGVAQSAGANLPAMRDQIAQSGRIMGGEALASAEEYGRSWNRLMTKARAFLNQAMVPVMGYLSGTVIPFVTGTVIPAVKRFADAVGPGLQAAFTGLVAATSTAVGFIQRFKGPIAVLAGLIVASYIPAMVLAGKKSLISAGQQVVAWTMARGAALKSVAVQIGAMVKMVAKFAWAAVKSLAHGARMAAAWVIAMGPVGWVIAAVVALVALIIANWDKIVAWTKKAWTWVTDKIGQAWTWIKETTSKAVAAVVGFFTDLRDKAVARARALKAKFEHEVASLKQQVEARVQRLKDRVVGFFTDLRDKVSDAAQRARDSVVDKFQSLKDGAIDKARALLDWIRGLPGRIVRGLGNLGSLLLDAGRSIIDGLTRGIREKISGAVDAVRNGVGRIRNLLPFSPAKEGPLAGSGSPDLAGAKIATMLAGGMRARLPELVAAAHLAAAAARPDAGDLDAPPLATMHAARPASGTTHAGSPAADATRAGIPAAGASDGETVALLRRLVAAAEADQTLAVDGREVARAVARPMRDELVRVERSER